MLAYDSYYVTKPVHATQLSDYDDIMWGYYTIIYNVIIDI